VLGEEPGGGGTARYVDSSVERLQVKVSGMTGDRHIVTCNGRRVPLQPTGAEGVFVAGIRYRAWQPPSCLHPTIGVHTPLVVDLFDTWSGRAVGGCTYHVGHPGGRHHEIFPVNASEPRAAVMRASFPVGTVPAVRDGPGRRNPIRNFHIPLICGGPSINDGLKRRPGTLNGCDAISLTRHWRDDRYQPHRFRPVATGGPSLFDAAAVSRMPIARRFRALRKAAGSLAARRRCSGGHRAEELRQRQERVRRMRHEDGATYNPFDDPAGQGTPGPWR
jgi:hypothetical protein